jgi:PEGA domain
MRALLFGLLLLLGIAFSGLCRADPSEPAADSVARAEQLFHEGTKAFEAAEYAEAYTALKSAWELAPSYRTAAGLGQVELQIERFRDAAYHLSYCLRHYPQDGDAAIRTHVEDGLEQARTHVAALRVRVGVEGADVAVDGASVGKSPLDGLVFVDPGSHKVTASHAGYRLAEADVETPVRATRDVSLSLVSDENSSLPRVSDVSVVDPFPRDTPHARAPSGLSATSWVLIVGGSLTAAALATSIVFAVKGGAASDDLKAAQADVASGGASGDACRAPTGTEVAACGRVHDLADTRNTDNQIAILGAIVSGALAAATAGTAVYVNSREHAERSATGRPFVHVAAGPSGGSVVLGTAF